MYIMGLNLSHDYSACLVKDGEIKCAIALERISRIKRGIVRSDQLGYGIHEMINYCIKSEKISLEDINYFIANTTETKNNDDERNLLKSIGIIPQGKILSMPHPSHHLSHASAGFYTSSFQHAAALVIDCYGSLIGQDRESETSFIFSYNNLPEVIFRNMKYGSRVAGILCNGKFNIPKQLQGVGEIYRIITLLLGFVQSGTYYDDAGKTMGLAPYGKLISKEPVMMKITNGAIDYSNAYNFLASFNLISEENGESYLNIRQKNTPLSQFHMDLAAQVQMELEEVSLFLTKKLRDETNQENLVLSGGTFLNSVTNYRILKESGYKNVYILPPATDDGNAIGTALYAYYNLLQPQSKHKAPYKTIQNFYTGKIYTDHEIKDAIDSFKVDYKEMNTLEDVADFAAKQLSENKIIGWHQGASEFGPRALGNRSILANPIAKDIKSVLNNRVKFRENYRPFAPIVLAGKAKEYFDINSHLSPYMLLICPVLKKYQTVIPGVTHIDNTARLQTLTLDANPLLYRLIKTFEGFTNIPIILNTSFNLKGMPIVETPEDAIECFLATSMDYLIIGKYIIFPPKFIDFVPSRNDLIISFNDVWPNNEMNFEPSNVKIMFGKGKRVILDEPEISTITKVQWKILKTIDSNMTIKSIGEKLNIANEEIINEVLKLYRHGFVYWKHLGGMKASYFDSLDFPQIGPLPYL
jgi:carbamoyltransferase